jgi:hypothetical protein
MQFKKKYPLLAAAIVCAALAGCDDGKRGPTGLQGDPGSNGTNGTNGSNGSNGANGHLSLLTQTLLGAGHQHCFKGGVQIDSGIDTNDNALLDAAEITDTNYLCSPSLVNFDRHFNRVATFPVCQQMDAACDTNTVTAAEITAVSKDGKKLIYTDSPGAQIGFVDINNAAQPKPAGVLAMGGEPTSVAVKGDYALVGVNTSADFVSVSGVLNVVNTATETVVRSINLGGQPDSVAVSPDGKYAVVVIENERDEDLGDGAPPQLPAGNLVIVDMSGAVASWTTRTVALTGIATLFSEDPEPEYVDINSDNVAVVTLQENNHIVLVNLVDGSIINDFSAGSTDLFMVDATEEDLPLVKQIETLLGVPREPDGVAWINNHYFATADEGDLDGGSRTVTIFNTEGDVVWSSGSELEYLAASAGHYNEGRSENKGNEPENVEVGVFGDDRYLFINSERSSLVFVFDVANPEQPIYKQTLPAALGPEGVIAIPSRNLLVVSSEEDERGLFRGGLNIYQYNSVAPIYPTLESVNRTDGTPIPWSAMSGLSADPQNDFRIYSVEDSAFAASRIFTIDISSQPAWLSAETRIKDSNNVLASFAVTALADATVDDDHASRISVFDEADLAAMINADKTVNLDPEGIARASDGGFWIASEGSGTVGDAKRPVNSHNLILKTTGNGVITQVIGLPAVLNNAQSRFGLEGVTEKDGKVYVAFQRQWSLDAAGMVRIGAYDIAAKTWEFFLYPLDAVASPNGGWVGLSDITALGSGRFLVLERDNQAGPDARIKRLYQIDISGLADGAAVAKTLVRDLIPDLQSFGGLVPEKIEGSTVLNNGQVMIINDNDGLDDNSGETLLINIGKPALLSAD